MLVFLLIRTSSHSAHLAYNSHLNQVLKNVSNGASPSRSSLIKSICNEDGTISIDKVRACDPELAEYATNGIRWEVLKSDIESETHGRGPVLIQVSVYRA